MQRSYNVHSVQFFSKSTYQSGSDRRKYKWVWCSEHNAVW